MAINLLEKTTAALGYSALKKIDPTTEEIHQQSVDANQALAQAVIPAVLAGISQLSKSEDGINIIMSGSKTDWANLIFGDHKSEITGNIAGYAMSDLTTIENKINEAALTAITLIREINPDSTNNNKMVKDFIKSQRDNILPFLPTQLHLGSMMNNSTIDDKTNKMQGPISSLMHKIEASFGGNETEQDADKKSNTT